MSDDTTRGTPAAEPAKRAPASIDLPKSAVTDLTPPPESQPAPPPEPEVVKEEPAKVEAAHEPEPEAALPPPPAPKARKTGAILGGALAGGVAGVAAAFGLQSYIPAAATADPRLPALQASLGAAEKKLAETTPEFARAAAALKAAEERAAAALKAAEARIAALETRPPEVPASVSQRLGALDQKLTSLDGGLTGLRAVTEGAARKLEEIEKLASAPSAPATPAADAPAEPPRIDLAPVAARIVRLEEALAEANRKLAETTGKASGLAETAAGLDGRVKSTEAAVAELKVPRAADPTPAILAIAGLARRALDAGEPVTGPAAALAALGAEAEAVKALAALGDAPPRLAALAGQLASLAAAAAPKPPAEPQPAAAKDVREMSVAERLKANIGSLVEVRPAGAPKPPAPADPLTAARTAILAGDAGAAAKALDALPADQKAALKPVTDALAQRLAALAGLARIEAAALAATQRKP